MNGGRIIFRQIDPKALKKDLITGQYAIGFTDNGEFKKSSEGDDPVSLSVGSESLSIVVCPPGQFVSSKRQTMCVGQTYTLEEIYGQITSISNATQGTSPYFPYDTELSYYIAALNKKNSRTGNVSLTEVSPGVEYSLTINSSDNWSIGDVGIILGDSVGVVDTTTLQVFRDLTSQINPSDLIQINFVDNLGYVRTINVTVSSLSYIDTYTEIILDPAISYSDIVEGYVTQAYLGSATFSVIDTTSSVDVSNIADTISGSLNEVGYVFKAVSDPSVTISKFHPFPFKAQPENSNAKIVANDIFVKYAKNLDDWWTINLDDWSEPLSIVSASQSGYSGYVVTIPTTKKLVLAYVSSSNADATCWSQGTSDGVFNSCLIGNYNSQFLQGGPGIVRNLSFIVPYNGEDLGSGWKSGEWAGYIFNVTETSFDIFLFSTITTERAVMPFVINMNLI